MKVNQLSRNSGNMIISKVLKILLIDGMKLRQHYKWCVVKKWLNCNNDFKGFHCVLPEVQCKCINFLKEAGIVEVGEVVVVTFLELHRENLSNENLM